MMDEETKARAEQAAWDAWSDGTQRLPRACEAYAKIVTEPLRAELDEALDVLQMLASYVGANGTYDPKTPKQLDERIRWGIDHTVDCVKAIRADRVAQLEEQLEQYMGAARNFGKLQNELLDRLAEREKELAQCKAREPSEFAQRILDGMRKHKLKP